LLSIVRTVAARGGKVRAFGALHSWSNIYSEDGATVVFLDQFKSIVQDPNDYSIVTVQCTPHHYRHQDHT
jgi:FAD/FMN-containing dehydrogenase